MPQTIRAVVVDPGAEGRLAIQPVELRDPDRDEVVVRVTAISLNRGETRRALTQAGRELLLAQSSDWAFIMKTGTMAEYAVKRTKEHLTRFTSLYEQLRSGRIDAAGLKDIEERDNLFPSLDYHNFS